MKIIANKSILHNNVTNCTYIAGKLDEKVQTGTRENDQHIEWMGDLDIPTKPQADTFRMLYEQIKHGDQEHQDWLKDKIEYFIKQQGLE